MVDDERASNCAEGGGIKVEGAIEVFPYRYVWGKGELVEEVQGEFYLSEELVPQEVGEGIGDAGKDEK